MGRMLSYRHGFHAGNAADVLKHMVLIFCLEYLLQKEKPLLCIDTHAGAGSYPLLEGFAAKNREWEKGIGTLSAPDQPPLPALIQRYLELIGGATDLPYQEGNPGTRLHAGASGPVEYPGSPEIIRRLLRNEDRACCFELHPQDFTALNSIRRQHWRLGPHLPRRLH